MPRYRALCRHWEAHPPLARLVAAALGFKGGRRARDQDFAAFYGAMTAGGKPPR